MKRIEVIANQSVQADLIEAVEAAVPTIRYSLIPVVHGRGPHDWKLGTTVWPEENFVWFAYLEDPVATVVQKVVADLKAEFPHEGITIWTMKVE